MQLAGTHDPLAAGALVALSVSEDGGGKRTERAAALIRASTRKEFPWTGRSNIIESCIVALRRVGSTSAAVTPIAKSNTAANTPPLTADVPRPPRCSGLIWSMQTSTRSPSGKLTRAPKYLSVWLSLKSFAYFASCAALGRGEVISGMAHFNSPAASPHQEAWGAWT